MDDDVTTEPSPPWVAYPNRGPTWGGWRQGYGEAWLHEVWLPFWRAITPGARRRFLTRWPPPSEDWKHYLEIQWSALGVEEPK